MLILREQYLFYRANLQIPIVQININKLNLKMLTVTLKNIENMSFVWAATRIRDTQACHGLVHTGLSHCFEHFLVKLIDTGKVASKYYILFHVIPLIIRLKKCKKFTDFTKTIKRSILEYGRSILFMSFLVGLLRAGLCLSNHPNKSNIWPNRPGIFKIFGLLSASSIMLQDQGRRNEIAYYVTAKAMRAVYQYYKRNMGWSFKHQGVIVHIVMMALLNYIYHHQPEILKFKNLFDYIIGQP